MTDHYALAVKTLQAVLDYAETDENTDALVSILAAQAQASLALAEQQRIANVIALADPLNPRAETQIVADARDALTEFHPHDDETLGGWVELRPEIARTLRIETP